MTLVSADESEVLCMWFDPQEKCDSKAFPMHVLRAYRAPSDGSWTLASLERRGADKV
jgi:hypothetical protein